MANSKTPDRENNSAASTPSPSTPGPGPVPPLFRKIDWLTLLLTFATVFVVYLLTLAPELTLEDSGELVTASVYAGIPHPPGYPVWAVYSWLWTVLLPFGNFAWRVAVGEAMAGALASGLLAFLVSRGSSLFMESIEELKNLPGHWEGAICIVTGFVAGVLVGLDGFIWSESVVVNRIAVFSLSWVMLLLICLLRYLYAPHQLRYAYLAVFLHGVCITIHQSLIVAAIAVQIIIALGNPRLGRNAFFANFLIYSFYMAVWVFTGQHLMANIGKPGMFIIFNLIGVASLVAAIWLSLRTTDFFKDWLPILIMAILWGLGVSAYLYMAVSGMTDAPMQWGYPRTVEGFFHAISRGQYEQPNPTNVIADPGRFISQLSLLISGVADEFSWVYIFVAFVPFLFFFRMQRRERCWLIGLTSMWLCLGVLLIILLNPSTDRASADLIRVFLTSSHTIVALLIGYGLALTAAFMATNYQRFRWWGMAGGAVAFVLALYCLFDATGNAYFGRAGWPSIGFGLSEAPHWIVKAFEKDQYGLPVFANLILVAVTLAFVAALLFYRKRAPLLITLGLFSLLPLYSALAHCYGSEQHNHWFGYWFGHDMFSPPFKGKDGKPLYPPMTKDAVLYGGTDPGRFCPEYMIYAESFTPHNCQPKEDQTFDRRDVYIITQNALADGTYLCFIRSHYNRSTQKDPPFFSELVRFLLKDKDYETNILARMVSPLDNVFEALGARVEMQRRTYTSWFKEDHFTDLSSFAAKLRPGAEQDPLSKYIYDNLSPETRQALAAQGSDLALRRGLMKDLNLLLKRELDVKRELNAKQHEKDGVDQSLLEGASSDSLHRKQERLASEIAELNKKYSPLYEPERFKQVTISEYLQDFIKENPQSDTRVRLNRLLLEAAYPKEIAKSIGGVYPDREIYSATVDDSQKCFHDYLEDAQRRLQHDMQFPNEPKQLRPGEDVHLDNNRVTVAGQVAVMAINGLLTKVIFDHNPKNEFFVEESFPLDWMYPHLTPFGVIMKINRNPLPSLSEDVLERDHSFWRQYSGRLIGDFIDYGTSVKQVVDFIEKTYLHRNFAGFQGDRRFVRDDDAQKSFSKLRSSIGGIYAWRLMSAPPEYRPKSEAEFQRMYKEADFAFLQAFAFCPYSPEAVFRYATMLAQFHRVDDAILVAETCLKLDPYNGSVQGLIEQLKAIKQQGGGGPQPGMDFARMEDEVRKNPTNFEAALELANTYFQFQQTDRASQILDGILNSPNVDARTVLRVAQEYVPRQNYPKIEVALEKLTKLQPEAPEAWYDLGAVRAVMNKTTDSLTALKTALDLNAKRLAKDPKAPDLHAMLQKDDRFGSMRSLPEFQKLLQPLAEAPH